MGQRQTLTFGLDEIEGIEEITFGLDEIELEGPRPYRPEVFRLPRADTVSPLPAVVTDRKPDFRSEVIGELPKEPQESDEPILARLPKNAVRALGAGVLRFNMGFWGGLEAAGDVLGLPSVASWAKQRGGEARKLAQAVRGPQRGAGPTEQAVYGGFESLGLSVPTLLAGAATANPATSLALFGSVTAGDAYATARKQGVPIAQAVNYAVSQGAIEAATEKIPASRLLRDLTGRRGLGRTLLRQLTTEIPGEQAATALQDLNDWAVLNPDQPLSRYLTARPSAAAQTLVSTLVATVGQTAGLAAAERVLREKAQVAPETTTEPPPPLRAQAEPVASQAPVAPPEVPLPAPVEVSDPIAAQFGGERLVEPAPALAAAAAPPEITFRPEEIEQEEPRAAETGIVPPSNQPEYQGTPEGGPQAEPGRGDRAVERPAAPGAEEEPVTAEKKPSPFAVLQTALPELGFTLSTDAETIYNSLRQDTRKVLTRNPTRGEMRAVVESWIAWAKKRESSTRSQSFKRIAAALRTVPPPATDVARPAGLLTEAEADRLGAASNVAPSPVQAPDLGTRPPAPPIGPVAVPSDQPSAPSRRLSKTRQREADLIAELVTHAQSRGYAGDPAVLSDALTSRAQIVREINQEVDAAGATPAALLRAIREGGGISEQAETGQKGEIAWLKESPLKQAQGGKVFRRDGLTLDGMVEYLQQDPRFQHITDINDLVEELTDIAQGVNKGPGALSARALGATGEQWWDRLLPAPEPVDVTDTGEIQPRLPEAGAVREQEQPTPTFEAPFSLTGEAATRTPIQSSLLAPKPSRGGGGVEAFSGPRPTLGPARDSVPTGRRGDKQLRPSEIVARLSTRLADLPVRVGKFRQRALGIYKRKPQVVRLKVANDLAVLAHEIGHHVDHALIRIRSPQVKSELLALGQATSRPSYSPGQVRNEGAAEFLRLYLGDPAQAAKTAPNYLAAFEAALTQEPELQATLLDARRQYQGYIALDPKARVLAHIDFKGTDKPGATDRLLQFQTAWVDDLAVLRQAEGAMADGRPVNILKSGYALARLARGAPAKADGFLRHGPRGLDGRILGPSLDQALGPVQDRIHDFVAYLVASRVVELKGRRGLETGIDLADARVVVKELQTPVFDHARDQLYAYQNGVLAYAEQAGVLSADQANRIRKANQFYVPFRRIQDALDGYLQGGGPARRLVNRAVPIKRYRGSGADLINPLESIVRNTHAIVDMVEKNRALGAFITQAEHTVGAGKWIEAVPAPQELTRVHLADLQRDLARTLADAGLETATVMGPDGPTLEVEGTVIDLDQIVNVFSPAHFVKGEKGLITHVQDGKRRFYQVNNLALYDALTAVGVQPSDLIINLFMVPARVLRAGATLTTGFLARNPLRDTFTAAVNSRYGFRPGYDTLRGLFEYLKKGEDYQQFLVSGGGNSAMLGPDRNRIREYLTGLGVDGQRRWLNTTVLNPMNLLRAVSEAGENATRLGEFLRAVEQEGRTPEGYARAALAARDVSIDFARGGRYSKEINRYTAFFNAATQGLARLAEVFSGGDRPPVAGAPARASRALTATWRALAAVTLPTLALWYLHRDDEEYRELPAWEKLTYWHIPLGKGRGYVRVPTPFDLFTIFGAVPHAALDYLHAKDPAVAKQLFPDEESAWQVVLSFLPTAILPVVEVTTNYDTFRKRPIVSPWDLGLEKDLQVNRWTSGFARTVGPKIGLAPAKLDHLLYGYFAGLGRAAISATDIATGQASERSRVGGVRDWPFLGDIPRAFVRPYAGSDAQSIQELYEIRDRLAGLAASLKQYQAQGQAARVDALRQERDALRGMVGNVNGAIERLSALRQQIDRLWADETLSPVQKRERQDRLFERMVNVARAGLNRPALPSRVETVEGTDLQQKAVR